MTTIIFVRHGESLSNILIHQNNINKTSKTTLTDQLNEIGDPHLTVTGNKQSIAVGEYLCKQLGTKYVRVLTSLFTRTQETSKPFCDMYSKYIKSNDSLELLSEYTKPEKKLTKEHLKRGLKPHQNWDEFTKTIKNFVIILEEMDSADCSEPITIVIFGHSLYISVLTSYLGSRKTFIPTNNQLVFRCPNCSITTVEYSNEISKGWKINNVASIAHLPKEIVTGIECDYGTR